MVGFQVELYLVVSFFVFFKIIHQSAYGLDDS